MRGITLQRLQVFCAVYERNSITAAARTLGLSQPTVSRHLRDFESASNLTLFVLERGRVMPTAEADAIYSESRFLQDGIGRLETRIDNLREGTGSKLSIMTIGMLMPQVVPRAVLRLRDLMPNLRVSIDVGTADRQLASIRSGQADIGIMAGRIPAQDEEVTLVGEGHLVALIPESASVAALEKVTLKDLAGLKTVDSTARGPIGRILDEAMRNCGLSVEGTVMCNSLIAVPYMASMLHRAALLDGFTARAHPQPGLVTRPLDPALPFPIMTVTLSPTGSQVATDHLIQSLRHVLATLPQMAP